ncbi:MAG: TIGR01212 family radical SAM protein [Peptoclostridium sp.]|uniref:TIGR01212 family radical SAM protein n=1 Tax=Peptoclostridium sp. TaxID=1904860 RepID=UPI00139B465F|nr:TIGR01212 family radical SAM protein [Peptoclostridium sp.]MZQ75824.1 TIGR01212 family radical SAM protein [Peptoclostridium sp.]
MNRRYNAYSDYLVGKYGEKVYRLPVNLPLTCPNRDGQVGEGGCTFCAEVGAGFEAFDSSVSIKDQLLSNKEYIGSKYKARKFIAYFQNYTNTYVDKDTFRNCLEEALLEDIVEIAISTRPDAISDEYLQIMKELEQKGVAISIELGLQTVNYHTLKAINRGHTLAEFIDAVIRIKKFGFESCAHVILNLPGDEMLDVIETAKVISALGVDGVKLHSLYIPRCSQMALDYEGGKLQLSSLDEYVKRAATFMGYLSQDVIIERLVGRAPEEDTLFCNWNTSWWKIKDMIERYMDENYIYQGKFCDYLNGKALRRWE